MNVSISGSSDFSLPPIGEIYDDCNGRPVTNSICRVYLYFRPTRRGVQSVTVTQNDTAEGSYNGQPYSYTATYVVSANAEGSGVGSCEAQVELDAVTFEQPAGKPVVKNSLNKPVFEAGKPAIAILNIKASGLSAVDTRVGWASLSYGGVNVSDEEFQASALANTGIQIRLPFIPDGRGGVEDQDITASVGLVSETKVSTKTEKIKVYTLCSVAEKGREVPFYSQGASPWGADVYGVTRPPRAHRFISQKGCALTALAMVANSYGIKQSASGRPLDPGVLNQELATYAASTAHPGGISYTPANGVDWAGAVNSLRNNAALACVRAGMDLASCRKQSLGKVSFLGKKDYDEKAIEREICSGNPVVLHVTKNLELTPSHFVLATGTTIDQAGDKTLIVNDPGFREGASNILSARYKPSPTYRLLRSAHDPTMFFIYGSENIDFVVTDSEGRRTGRNPLTNQVFNEIPGATYYTEKIESIDPSDSERDEEERVFQSLEPLDASHSISIYSVSGGHYTLEIKSYDVDGQFNKRVAESRAITPGGTLQTSYVHSSKPSASTNSQIVVRDGHVSAGKDAHMYVAGKIKPLDSSFGNKLSLKGVFEFGIGGSFGITRSVQLSKFVKIPFLSCSVYLKPKERISIGVCTDGKFWIFADGLNLRNLTDNARGAFMLKVDSWIGETTIETNKHKACRASHEGF